MIKKVPHLSFAVTRFIGKFKAFINNLDKQEQLDALE